jgi:tetratricopeptide (TPR) repeat protein
VLGQLNNKNSFLARNTKWLWVPVIVLFVLSGYGTWKRNNVWHSEESLWLNVTVKSPKNGRGLMNYGNVLLNEGKYAEAEIYFDRAMQMLPDYSYVYMNMGALKEKQRQFADAEKYYLFGISLGGNYPVPYKIYGRFLNMMRRYREAEVVLKKSLQLSDADLETRTYLMQSFDALGEWDNLKMLATNTLQMDPGNADATSYLVDAQKQKSKVEIEAEQAIISPSAEKYLQLSLDYYNEAKFEQCISAAQQALKLKPNYAEAYNNIGIAYIGLGQYGTAADTLKKALKIKPGYVLAKNNLVLAENHTGGSAVPVKSPTPEDYINQGLNYYNLHMYDLCIAASESALELRPNYDLAYNNLCASYVALQQWDNAIKTGQKGLQINPNNVLLKNNLAQAIRGQKGAPK